MSRMHSMVSLSAGLALIALAAPQALAFAQTQGTADNPPPVKYTVDQHTVSLSPIVVNGQRISFTVALQMYKKALTRPWSSSREDLDKLVCVWHAKPGTHMQTLFCQTNRQHQKIAEATQTAMLTAGTRYPGGLGASALLIEHVPVTLANATSQTPIRRSTMAPLLAKLPPAGSSYTLRVTGDDGKPLIDYIIKDGDLVHIYKYEYKNGKTEVEQ